MRQNSKRKSRKVGKEGDQNQEVNQNQERDKNQEGYKNQEGDQNQEGDPNQEGEGNQEGDQNQADQNQAGDQNLERDQKNHTTSQDKKMTQPIGTTKNHATSWGKNVLKIQIIVTIKLQAIGTGHLGFFFFFYKR